MDVKDLFMQFGVLSNKRVSENQKIQYLTRLSHFFEENNYSMTILKVKHRGKQSFIGVVGDVKKAKYIIATHYDTPMIDFWGKDYEPFNDEILEKKSIKNLSISLIICLIGLFLLITFYVAPQFNNGTFNFHDVLGGVVAVLLIIFSYRTARNGGFTKRNNLVRNTSSVITILKFAQDLKDNKSNYAFAFVDYGCIDYFGYHVLKSYLGNYLKPIIMLDSVGNSNIQTASDKSTILSNIFKKSKFVYGTGDNREQDYDILHEGIKSSIAAINKLTD